MAETIQTIATWLVPLGAVYLGIGLLFAVAFVLRGAASVDPQAVEGSWGFRLAILPGAAALWPLLARRWMRGGPPPEESNAHREGAKSRGAGGGR